MPRFLVVIGVGSLDRPEEQKELRDVVEAKDCEEAFGVAVKMVGSDQTSLSIEVSQLK